MIGLRMTMNVFPEKQRGYANVFNLISESETRQFRKKKKKMIVFHIINPASRMRI